MSDRICDDYQFLWFKAFKLRYGSGAGTYLKLGEGAPVRRQAPEKIFGRTPPLFCLKRAISRFGERFRDGQYSLVSL